MRRGRRKGGMFKGVTHAELERMIKGAAQLGEDEITVRDGDRKDHQISVDSAMRMLEGFRGMTDFWAGKSKAERSAYIKSHYLRGTTHHPWQNMTLARLVKILNRARHNKYPRKFITRRGDPDFVNEWALLKKAPKDNKAKMFQAMLRQMVIANRLYQNRKTRKIRAKYEPAADYDDLLLQFDGWDSMVHKRGRRNAPGAAVAAAATAPLPPPPAAIADDDSETETDEDSILADPFADAPAPKKKSCHNRSSSSSLCRAPPAPPSPKRDDYLQSILDENDRVLKAVSDSMSHTPRPKISENEVRKLFYG